MNSECFFSSEAIALAIAAFIFFITLFLTAKQWISFLVTLVLLFFSLLAGLIIANQGMLHEYISGNSAQKTQDNDLKISHFQEETLKAYDGLKAEVEMQKQQVKTLTDEVEKIKKQQDHPAEIHEQPSSSLPSTS